MLEPSHQEILIPPPPFYPLRFFLFLLFAGVWKGSPGFHAASQGGFPRKGKGKGEYSWVAVMVDRGFRAGVVDLGNIHVSDNSKGGGGGRRRRRKGVNKDCLSLLVLSFLFSFHIVAACSTSLPLHYHAWFLCFLLFSPHIFIFHITSTQSHHSLGVIVHHIRDRYGRYHF